MKTRFKKVLCSICIATTILTVLIVILYQLNPINEATIEDYVLGADYEVIKVNELPVVRQKHGLFETKVPIVKVSAGKNTITVIPRNKFGTDSKRLEHYETDLKYEFVKGGRYRIVKDKTENPSIIELKD